MPAAESEVEAVRRQLERVLASPGFSRNERMSRFLRFVVDQHLAGKDKELKESVIAIDVLGRSPDHDPKRDSIVRTEAARLRARLSEYYLGEGKNDPLLIELPKGGYVPILRPAETGASSHEPSAKPPLRWVWLAAALACLAAGLVATNWWRIHQNTPIPIVVLPLHNLSPDPADDYFADGLTGEIIRNLSIIEGLAVRSQTSSFAFKGKRQNVREAGKQLAADYILEGTVLRASQQLRITVQLVRVRDDFPMWSGRYDRELTDVFVVQDEISRGIVNTLRLQLGRGRRRYETSTEAYDLYLRASALEVEEGVVGIDKSIGPFEQVIAKDPSFAPAYARLAWAYAWRSGRPMFNAAEEMMKMRLAAEKSIQLDPISAEAYTALGILYARQGQWDQSEKNFRRALELEPNRSLTRQLFAVYLLLPFGRVDEAVQQGRLAEKSDPLASSVHAYTAYTLISAHRFDDAASYCAKVLPIEKVLGQCVGRIMLGQGRVEEAIRFFTANPDPVDPGAFLGHSLGRAGRREEAERLAAGTTNPFTQALIFAGLGDKERTLEALDRMTVLGPVRMGRALTFPEFDLIRGDPRVKALRKKVGLPE
ncbi:MAG TPA: tetratricopeptide repeat protein [Bryobacteraceae bacterium]|nr:tetratricopeptide repeat protein [Bryobacteraceae bacterium]